MIDNNKSIENLTLWDWYFDRIYDRLSTDMASSRPDEITHATIKEVALILRCRANLEK